MLTSDIEANKALTAVPDSNWQKSPDGSDHPAVTSDINQNLYMAIVGSSEIQVKEVKPLVYNTFFFRVNKEALYWGDAAVILFDLGRLQINSRSD